MKRPLCILSQSLRRRSAVLAVIAGLLHPFFGYADADPKELIMGIISTESSSQLRKGFDPFLEELSEKLNMPVKAHFATDYAGVIEGMRFNKVHIAWMGNKAAIEAVDRAHAEVFAQTTKADGGLGYHSVLIVHQDSPLRSVEDVLEQSSNLVFGNGDPNSTSGFLIPSFYLWAPNGIDPQSAFKHTRNANHEVNCIATAMRQVDLAVANDEALIRFAMAKPKLRERLRVIWTSPIIPNDPLVWRKDLSREMKARIKGAIFSFGRVGAKAEAEVALLANVQDGWGPFLDADNTQLLPLREIDIEKQMQSIKRNEWIDDAEKKLRIQELEQKKLELLALRASLKTLAQGSL